VRQRTGEAGGGTSEIDSAEGIRILCTAREISDRMAGMAGAQGERMGCPSLRGMPTPQGAVGRDRRRSLPTFL